MLDFFTILTKGGLILWYIQNTQRDHLPFVNRLLSDVFVEERLSTQKYLYENIQMEYLVNNRWNVIYVVGYYRGFSLPYIKDLLSDADKAFENKLTGYTPGSVDFFHEDKDRVDFANDFDIILKYRFQQDSATNTIHHHQHHHSKSKETITDDKNGHSVENEEVKSSTAISTNNNNNNNKKITSSNKNSKNAKIPKTKTARVWDEDFSRKNMDDSSLMQSLDFSSKKDGVDSMDTNVMVLPEKETFNPNELSKTLYESITSKKSPLNQQQNNPSKFFDYFKGLVGSREISHENLETIMTSMKHHLCDKNVASEIADDICVSVTNKLIGKSLGTFELLKNTVKSAMVEAIQKVLIPSNEFDLLAGVDTVNKDFQRPYVIVMCGVNGVGKSTNLAKISHYLMVNKNYHLMIAACDTFRSGAVEQLRTHVTRLNHISTQVNVGSNNKSNNDPTITLYDKGYNKDASMVAKEAIIQAKKLNKNVVLIDTAGRMQDNEPLMRSLAKLIHINNPDLVLFVGEALVGNDGVDQLKKFNNSLNEYACNNNPHLIDGIVLTKFDTIDDKVGAAISMTYTSGKPIMFVGIGQTYSDIKKLDVDSVVKLLFQ